MAAAKRQEENHPEGRRKGVRKISVVALSGVMSAAGDAALHIENRREGIKKKKKTAAAYIIVESRRRRASEKGKSSASI